MSSLPQGPVIRAPAYGTQHPQHPPRMPTLNVHRAASDTFLNNPVSLPQPIPEPQRDWNSMTRTIAHYERLEQIGEGTYGQVYRARCKDTDQIVALKKIRVHHGGYWGMPPTVIREIKILKRLHHPNLVQMVEVVSSKGVEHLDEDDEVEEKHKATSSKSDRIVDAREGYKGNLFLVLEYVSHDLTGLLDVAYKFTDVQVKCIFRQLLQALQYMHEQKYVHRDIKSSNILIDHCFRVKLADFGLARCIEPPILDNIHDRGNTQEFTNKVITLWYRPPEILLGATRYGPPVDVWSAGCILAELILGKPILPGKTEMDQLQLIFELIGTPTPESWEGLNDLKLLRTGDVTIDNSSKKPPKLKTKYSQKIPQQAMSLLEKLLELDPSKRLTASRALGNRYFVVEPRAPERPEDLGRIQVMEGGHFHEFQTKKKRREAKAIAEKVREAAREGGLSERDAQKQYDARYLELMQKVAREGVTTKTTEEDGGGDQEPPRERSSKERRHGDKSERPKEENEERRRRRRDRDPERKRRDSDGKERSRRHERKGDNDSRRGKRNEDKSSRRDSEERRRSEERPSRRESEELPSSAEKAREKQQVRDQGPSGDRQVEDIPKDISTVPNGKGAESPTRLPDRSPSEDSGGRHSRKRKKDARDRSSERRPSRDHEHRRRPKDRHREHRRSSRDGDREKKRSRSRKDRDRDDRDRDRDRSDRRERRYRERDRDRPSHNWSPMVREGPSFQPFPPRGQMGYRSPPDGGPYHGPPEGSNRDWGGRDNGMPPRERDARGPPPPGYYGDRHREDDRKRKDRSPRHDKDRFDRRK